MENRNLKNQLVEFIVSTTAYTECNNIEVSVAEDKSFIKVTVMGNQFTFFNTGEVYVVLDGEYTIEDLDNIKDVMASGEEIWMMFDKCNQ